MSLSIAMPPLAELRTVVTVDEAVASGGQASVLALRWSQEEEVLAETMVVRVPGK